jgi:hypothetical protein
LALALSISPYKDTFLPEKNCALSSKPQLRIESGSGSGSQGSAVASRLTERDVLARLRNIIETMPRTKIVQYTALYLRAEFKSAIFGFIDDVELLSGEEPGVIHIRSASRVGCWDLGVNRGRVERIREEFIQNQQTLAE